jgi:hypothetical protein
VSIAMAKHESSNDILGSALAFYLLLGMVLMIVEIVSGGSFGGNFFSGLRGNTELKTDYFNSLIILCFILPTGLFNGVFLFYDKLYLQPLMNLTFSIIIVLGLIGLFSVAKITTKSVVFLLILASCTRFFLSFSVSYYLHKVSWKKMGFVNDLSFYKSLLLSGLSVGFVFIIPYLFRGGVPRYVEGGFSLASMAFKVNDLVVSLLIIPIVSLLIKRNSLSFKPGLLLTLSIALAVSLLACLAMYYIPAIYTLEAQKFKVIQLSILSGIFITPSVFVTLYFVNIAKTNVSFLAGLVVFLAVLFFGNRFEQLSFYFYYLYILFFVFITIHVIYYVFFFNETSSNE